MGKILFRGVIEVLGKPKEHVDDSIKEYIENLRKNEKFEVTRAEFADLKKQDNQDLWAAFAEVEARTEKVDDLISFCFDFMPSVVEILEPKELALKGEEVSIFLNDLQARLHQVDMVAKQMKMENDVLKNSMTQLLRNNVLVLLGNRNLSSDALSTLTGVAKDKLEDFLDQLIDEGKIDMKEGIYYLKKED